MTGFRFILHRILGFTYWEEIGEESYLGFS
jgi:hypothetical protein